MLPPSGGNTYDSLHVRGLVTDDPGREVPDVTNFYSDQVSELSWASRLGVSSLPSTDCLGISVPAAEPFAVSVDALPRVRGKVAVLVPQAQKVAVGQTNIHNYMTGAVATGGGASGPPPRDRGPA
jgi:hypothetical protein